MDTELNPRPGWASADGLVRLQGPDRVTDDGAALDKLLAAEVLYRFGFAYDEQDRATLTDCFTDDVVLSATTAGRQSFGTHRGRDAVIEWLTAYWGMTTDQRRHLVTNAVVDEMDGQQARVTTMLLVTAAQDGAFRPVTAGLYSATVRKDSDGAWRISSFDLGFDAAF